MKKCKLIVVSVATMMSLGVVCAHAQLVDGQPNVTTVKSVMKDGKDDQWVVLQGNIVQRIKGDDYRFRDSTGTIEVEIDDHVFKGQQVTPGTMIRIEGEVDTELIGDNKVDVERLIVIK